MIIGVPKEIKADEKRVAMTQSGVSAFVERKHKVLIERGAGEVATHHREWSAKIEGEVGDVRRK